MLDNIDDFVNNIMLPGIKPQTFYIKFDNKWCNNFDLDSKPFSSEEAREDFKRALSNK